MGYRIVGWGKRWEGGRGRGEEESEDLSFKKGLRVGS